MGYRLDFFNKIFFSWREMFKEGSSLIWVCIVCNISYIRTSEIVNSIFRYYVILMRFNFNNKSTDALKDKLELKAHKNVS